MSATPQQHLGSRPVLSTSEASAKSGLTREYISYLLQTGRIEGTKPGGHDWMVYEDSLDAFLAQPRSKGRKGPRKRREMRHTEHGDRVLLSTAEASDVAGYRKDSLLRLLRYGAIEGERSGRTWLIYEDSLLAYKHRKHPTIVESTLVKPDESLTALPEAFGESPTLPATSESEEPSPPESPDE